MFTREEQQQKNTAFWMAFKQFMQPYRSSNGRRINWQTYPSDVKDVFIRLEADGKGARLCFDIQPKDTGVRAIIWEQMTELKNVMELNLSMSPEWIEHFQPREGRVISRIMWENKELNFHNEQDHPLIVEFFRDRLIEFDRFYQEFKELLILLTQ